MTVIGQMYFYLSAILFPRPAFNQAKFDAAADQCHYAMMMRLKAFGQFTHGRPVSPGITLYMQQQLVLQRRQAVIATGFFAEAQKNAQLVAKFG